MARRRSTILPMEEPGGRKPKRGRWKWYVLAVIVAVIALTWIDGGEEPLRPIVQEVAIPDSASAGDRP